MTNPSGSPSDRPDRFVDEVFRTDDVEAASAFMRRVDPRVEIRATGDGFHFEHVTRGMPEASFSRITIAARMTTAIELRRTAAFGFVLAGGVAARSRGETVDASRPFLLRPGSAEAVSERLDVLVVNLDERALAARIALRLGIDEVSLDFTGTAPVSEGMLAHWARTARYAWRGVIQVDELMRNPLVRTATLEAVAEAALAAFPIVAVPLSAAPSANALSAAMERGRRFIEDHAHQPITVAHIAEEARLSVRALQSGFQRAFGTTPLAYVRRVRLHEARRALLSADAAVESVADIAREWGFGNLGRFAGDYRELFGENPGHTLRR